jgi:hypothetical protein
MEIINNTNINANSFDLVHMLKLVCLILVTLKLA